MRLKERNLNNDAFLPIMICNPQLCLGTAQFGLPYGITNQSGQVPEDEVRRILELAVSSGVNFVDTAQAYGSAETVLGRCWPTDAPRRLISKLPGGAPREIWEESLTTSMQRLKISKLDGFLVHRATDLLGPDGMELINWLKGLQERGLVNRIGVSIYESSDLQHLPLDCLQLVQLPLSVYDQRLIHDGTVKMLLDMGIAVHVRSVLLQGLLLKAPQHWPDHLSLALRHHHFRWLDYLSHNGISPLAGALGFIRTCCTGVEAVLCGVVSRQELSEVLQAWSQSKTHILESPEGWAWQSRLDLDPRGWPPR